MFRGEQINVTENRAVLHVALRAARGARSSSTGRMSSPRSTRCWTGWRLRRPGAHRRVEGPHRQADPQHRQHRHRRLRPRPGHGLRGAAPLQPSATCTFRFVSNVDAHRLRRGHPRPRPGGDPVHRLLEDLHHPGDDDQRPDRARLGAGRRSATRPPSPSTSWPSRPTPRRSRSSASTPPTCSASGSGSAGATRWTPPSACPRCWPSGPSSFREMLAGFHEMDEHFRTAPFARNLPVLMGLLAVWYGDFFGAQTVGVMPYEQYLKRFPGLPPAADDGVQRQARDAGRERRVDYETGADLLGRAGHQRPAHASTSSSTRGRS